MAKAVAQGKIVLITGCSSGIGRALAKEWAMRGATVVATARDPKKLEGLENVAACLMMDVTLHQTIQACATEVEKRFGRIDILVNNAGGARMGSLLDLAEGTLAAQFALNVEAPVAVTRAFFPLLRESARQGKRPIVADMGSVSGDMASPFSGAYCASKAALHSIDECLRMELAPFGISVVSMRPGGIRSSFGEASLAGLTRPVKGSPYEPLIGKIEKRALASQEGATPTDEFARRFVDILSRRKLPKLARLGKNALLYMIVGRLPRSIADSIRMKAYGLKAKM